MTPYFISSYGVDMEQSTLTSKGQTTIPIEIRERLGLKPGDRIAYEERNGEIVLRAQPGVASVTGILRSAIKKSGSRRANSGERETAHRQWAKDGKRGA